MERFKQVMQQNHLLALATCSPAPRVRVVNYCWNEHTPGIVYFSTDRTNQKVADVAQNPTVAFTTIPQDEEEGSHVRATATARKCDKSIWQMKELFLPQNPGMEDALAHIGDALDVYELHFTDATLEGAFAEPQHIRL